MSISADEAYLSFHKIRDLISSDVTEFIPWWIWVETSKAYGESNALVLFCQPLYCFGLSCMWHLFDHISRECFANFCLIDVSFPLSMYFLWRFILNDREQFNYIFLHGNNIIFEKTIGDVERLLLGKTVGGSKHLRLRVMSSSQKMTSVSDWGDNLHCTDMGSIHRFSHALYF